MEMSQKLREIDLVLALQALGHRPEFKKVQVAPHIAEAEDQGVPVCFAEWELQGSFLKNIPRRVVKGYKVIAGTVPHIHDKNAAFIQPRAASFDKVTLQEGRGRTVFVERIYQYQVVYSCVIAAADEVLARVMEYVQPRIFSRHEKKLASQVDDGSPDLDYIDRTLGERLQKKINERTAAEADHEYRPWIIHKEQRKHHGPAVILDQNLGPVQPDAALADSIPEIERPHVAIVCDGDLPIVIPDARDYRPFDAFLTH